MDLPASTSRTDARPFADRLAELNHCPWYWGNVSWRDSERLLELCDDGYFLVRDSKNESYLFTLSYRQQGKVVHSRIGFAGRTFFFGRERPDERNESVVMLINNAVERSALNERHYFDHRKVDSAQMSQLHLKQGLSRFDLLPRLQYICRLRIRDFCVSGRLHELPCPPALRNYLKENKYIVPDINEAVATLQKRRAIM